MDTSFIRILEETVPTLTSLTFQDLALLEHVSLLRKHVQISGHSQ
jgi:hypothetical protein